MTYVRIAQNNKIVTCNLVSNCFSFILQVVLAGKSVHSYEIRSFFSIFSRLGPFP